MPLKIQCACCGRFVPANPRVKNQKYCGEKVCQRSRKAAWQRQKLAKDEKYRAAQKDAQEIWCNNNPGYWAKYRENHLEYCERNRLLQKVRDQERKTSSLAKMDASTQLAPVIAGTYYLVPVLAKMDALRQKVHLITAA